MTDSKQIAVEEAALVRRVNRRLAHKGMQMFKARSHAATREAGPWFIVDLRQSSVTHSRLELESAARDLGALSRWECLAVEERS